MSQIPASKTLRRAALDAGIGLTLFLSLAFGLLEASDFGFTGSNPAEAAEISRIAASTDLSTFISPVELAAAKQPISSDQTSLAAAPDRGAVFLLAAVFAALFSFNLAFFRHLRRVYAKPRHTRVQRGR